MSSALGFESRHFAPPPDPASSCLNISLRETAAQCRSILELMTCGPGKPPYPSRMQPVPKTRCALLEPISFLQEASSFPTQAWACSRFSCSRPGWSPRADHAAMRVSSRAYYSCSSVPHPGAIQLTAEAGQCAPGKVASDSLGGSKRISQHLF